MNDSKYTVAVRPGDTRHLIEQAYNAGGPYQWAREAAVNSLQAKATWVQFGIVRPIAEKYGVAKRCVSDNGIGMTQEQLMDFMTSFGGGGRPIEGGQNFGQGIKSSTYPWNTFGIIVVSWSKDSPEGNLIWIHQDPISNNWELKGFDALDEDGDEIEERVLDLADYDADVITDMVGFDVDALRTVEMTKSGTVFIFLGDSMERDTANGDFKRPDDENTIRGIAKYLNERLVELPSGVSMSVVGLEAASESEDRRFNKDTRLTFKGGIARILHPRRVTGFKYAMKAGVAGEVTVDTHGTKIKWHLSKDAGVNGDGSYSVRSPQIVVTHSTTFDGVTLTEAFDHRISPAQYRNFGISEKSVAERLWLTIEPPALVSGGSKWGVYPQASRTVLLSRGGKALPWSEWGDEFYKNFPTEIQDAINESRSSKTLPEDNEVDDRVRSICSRLADRFRSGVLVRRSKGKEVGEEFGKPLGGNTDTGEDDSRTGSHPPDPTSQNDKTEGTVTGNGGSPLLRAKKGATVKGSTVKDDRIPEVEWSTLSADDGGVTTAAIYDPKAGETGRLTFNTTFPMFVSEFAYWGDEYPKASHEEVVKIVKDAYKVDMVARIMHINSLHQRKVSQGGESRTFNVEGMLTPEALTASCLGLSSVERTIRSIGGSKFGRAVKA